MTCRICNHGNAKKFGYFGKRRIQRWRCTACKSTFCEPHAKLTRATMISQPELATRAIQCLLEGCSIRSTERLTGLNRNTIMSLLLLAGARCDRLMRERMRNVSCQRVQVDELWTFVAKKNRRIRKGESSDEIGDQWIFVGMDADTKLIPAFMVGKRTMYTTQMFCWELAKRLANRIQLTTDGFHFYKEAVIECFGTDIDFAQLVKLFGDYGQRTAEARYSPPRITEVISKVRIGNPDPEHISTSFVERQNLTMRMQLRRLTRLTNAYSKRLANLKAAVALHFAYYNFCRVHSSLRVTPAMEAGLTDHIWTLEKLIGILE